MFRTRTYDYDYVANDSFTKFYEWVLRTYYDRNTYVSTMCYLGGLLIIQLILYMENMHWQIG